MSTFAVVTKFPVYPSLSFVNVGYFLTAPLIPGRFPVVEIIKVSFGLRLRILVDLPDPLSPTIAQDCYHFGSLSKISIYYYIVQTISLAIKTTSQ